MERAFGPVTWPRANVVYTVRRVDRSMSAAGLVLHLQEIKNRAHLHKGAEREPAFPVKYFRPLPKLRVEDFAAEGVSA
jgi:hypothetical protein